MIEIKAIIFDMDGTLVNNLGYHWKAWLAFLRTHNIIMSDEEINTKGHGTMFEIVPKIFGREMSDTEIKSLGEQKETMYRESYKEHLRELPGLTKFLEELKSANIKIGLGTMADRKNVEFTLGGLGIDGFFESKHSAEDVKHGKPDPEVFLLGAQQLGVSPEDCVVFEDSKVGIKAAINAGMRAVGVSTSVEPQTLLDLGASRVISDYEGLTLEGLL